MSGKDNFYLDIIYDVVMQLNIVTGKIPFPGPAIKGSRETMPDNSRKSTKNTLILRLQR